MSDVIAEIIGKAGCITLNRPKALNALSLGMVRAITQALLAWRDDHRVELVLVRGMGKEGAFGGVERRTGIGDAEGLRDREILVRGKLPQLSGGKRCVGEVFRQHADAGIGDDEATDLLDVEGEGADLLAEGPDGAHRRGPHRHRRQSRRPSDRR